MGCAKCHDVRLLELALEDVGKKRWDLKFTKGTFRGAITRRKENMQQNKGNKCKLKPKLEINNLENKNMEHEKNFSLNHDA